MKTCNILLIIFLIIIYSLSIEGFAENYISPSYDPYKEKILRQSPKIIVRPVKNSRYVLPSYEPLINKTQSLHFSPSKTTPTHTP